MDVLPLETPFPQQYGSRTGAADADIRPIPEPSSLSVAPSENPLHPPGHADSPLLKPEVLAHATSEETSFLPRVSSSSKVKSRTPKPAMIPHPGEAAAGQSKAPEAGMSLNVTIPLSYKEAVKVQYQDEPEVYSQFLKLIHDFDSQDIDIFGVMQRISQLFHGNPVLIRGFNTFLPVGYCVDVSSNTVTISTPQGTLTGGPDNFRSTRIIKPPSELGPNLLPYPSNITPPLTIYPPLGFRSITPQANGVFRVPEFNPLQERSVRDRDRDPLLNGQAPSDKPRPKNKRVKPADEDQEDEAILDVLLPRPRSEPGNDMNISINNVVKQVTEVLSKSSVHDQLLGFSAKEAQCTLDFLQDLLDVSGLPMISKRALFKTSLKLTRIHDCVPRCLMLSGFERTEYYPFAKGHFGDLWRGKVGGMEVAVKQGRIYTSDNNVDKVLRKIRREAIIWRQCDHPNVLPFYGIYRDSAPSTYCLVSPFMVNGSLRQYMKKTDNPDRHKLALDVTQGMNYLHTLSIVHGDLKGDNILITDDGRAVIADFGISFVMGVTSFATSSSHRGGTVRWQAPEVLNGGLNTFSADVYSLACVYFEVFDGTIPWSDLKDGVVIKNVCLDKMHPPYPKHLGSTGHAGLWWEVMTKCWSYEPEDRPTILDVRASLYGSENVTTTESKWDRSVPIRLRNQALAGKLIIPPGLPQLFNLGGRAVV